MVGALEAEDVEFEVDRENWETVMMFMRVQTQWRYGFAGPTGLDYAAVEAAMRMVRAEKTDDLFTGIQIMEVAALKTLAAERAK